MKKLHGVTTWAAPTSLVIGGLAAALGPEWLLPLLALVWLISIAVFTIYDRLGSHRHALLGLLSIALSLGAMLLASGGTAALIAALIAPAFVFAVLTFDYTGSTPTEGGSHFEERKWTITLDSDRCEGIFLCWEVCSEACFQKREEIRKVELVHDERCIRCGARVVQCPKDALVFEDDKGDKGDTIEPGVIRKFKLNLLGQRQVDTG